MNDTLPCEICCAICKLEELVVTAIDKLRLVRCRNCHAKNYVDRCGICKQLCDRTATLIGQSVDLSLVACAECYDKLGKE